MELRHLRYFVAVADELNFTRAAQRLHTAQPSLSQQIRDLENEIGTQLLERSKRKVELTEAGRVFLAEARLVLAQADRAVARARQAGHQQALTVKIGFVPAAEVAIFPAILPKLRMQFPGVHVELRSLTTMEQEDALLRGDIDIAFMRRPVHHPELRAEVVLTEPLIVLMPAGHPLAAHACIEPSMLDGQPVIQTNPDYAGQLYDIVGRYFDAHRIRTDVVQVATNILLNLNLVGMGLGVALLPAYVEALAGESLCCRPLANPAPDIDLLMVTRAEPHSRELDALVDLMRRAPFRRPG
ncbi:DNA-binding transcriptional regulator HcaR [Burkholderia sp. Bp9143]|uniref:DNA-binding transcriptional regulator HcaR n=1 Tax=Burkholderia sp. Bp9143 TaxID=2184574 RepID=UPI000F5A9590|nr:DNA-binding transcriptional regulator HcaR [Burkholderia sp. Bp9143]RQR35425.1 DNA-binding transcriptional regulator HcaR [Burkholderia sp. Bp9143]